MINASKPHTYFGLCPWHWFINLWIINPFIYLFVDSFMENEYLCVSIYCVPGPGLLQVQQWTRPNPCSQRTLILHFIAGSSMTIGGGKWARGGTMRTIKRSGTRMGFSGRRTLVEKGDIRRAVCSDAKAAHHCWSVDNGEDVQRWDQHGSQKTWK